MSTMTSGVIPETEMVWALDMAGRKVYGPATMVEMKTDDDGTPAWGFSGVRAVRSMPQQLIVHFIDGKAEVYLAAKSEEALDRMISRMDEDERKAKVERERRQREQANRVKITDLVGHVIRKVQIDTEIIVFTLEDGHVWAFDVKEGELTLEVTRPWVLTNGVIVTEVIVDGSLMILTNKPGYLTIPGIIEWEGDYEDDELRFGYAYEPTRIQLIGLPVIVEGKNC